MSVNILYRFFSLVLLVFVLTAVSSAETDKLSLPFLIGSKKVLVIGESYGQAESVRFLSETVGEYVNDGGCLKVGLEIPSDQQEILDSAMRGEVPVSEIQINDIIDSAAYRQMLADFSGQIKAGKCLSVHAIDAPASVPVSRDAWMEKEVVSILGDTPVVLLVGNARAVKGAANPGNDDSGKLLTERLRGRTFAVSTALQYWKPGQCEDRTVEYVNATDEKVGAYVKEVIGSVSAEVPEDPEVVTDGVLVWSCKETAVTEDIDVAGDKIIGDKLTIDEEETDVVVRDEKALKKIRWGVKNNYPVLGMTKEEAVEALGEPKDKEKIGSTENWTIQCFDSDGFYHTCFVLSFKDDILVKFRDYE